MCQIIDQAIANSIADLQIGLELRTPDNAVGVPFSITEIGVNQVTIATNSGGTLQISNSAFSVAMIFLIHNGNNIEHPVNIESNNVSRLSGPLCQATRLENGNTRCINYIAPILAHFGFIGISGIRLNSCWYV